MATLQEAVKEKIFKELINPHSGKGESVANGSSGQQYKESQWKVLVLDPLATRMISACCKMHEIMAEGITLVEDLVKMREPLPHLDAIYLISPTAESINQMLSDFAEHNKWTYRAAHVYFTEACSDELFTHMCKHPATKYKAIKTLKEINCAFLPYERRVFTLDSPGVFNAFYSPNRALDRTPSMERAAEQIATLCATLGELPSIRFRANFDRNGEFAQILQQKLIKYKADDNTMGDGPNKERSQLIILDRGFDPISPLLHELTFQAMAYDLLPIKNDVYTYFKQTPVGEKESEVILDESDLLWTSLKHQHIATVSQLVTSKLKNFADEKRINSKDSSASVKDVAQMVKKMPQYQRELNNYATQMHLAEDCMAKFGGTVKEICTVEQDLAMGSNAENERIKDPMRAIVPVLLNPSINVNERIRIIMLYVLYKGGLTDENLEKLIQHASIPLEEKVKIFNQQYLGAPVVLDDAGYYKDAYKSKVGVAFAHTEISPLLKSADAASANTSLNTSQSEDGNKTDVTLKKFFADNLAFSEGSSSKRRPPTPYHALNRKERVSEQTYQVSRWTPYLKDLIEDAVEDKLDAKLFPFISGGARGRGTAPASSARTKYNWHNPGRGPARTGPRLIFFILGGMTYSETRAAYEVADRNKEWDVIVGSTHMITPTSYVESLRGLSETEAPPAFDMEIQMS